MAWVAIDSTAPDSSDTTKTKGGKWVANSVRSG